MKKFRHYFALSMTLVFLTGLLVGCGGTGKSKLASQPLPASQNTVFISMTQTQYTQTVNSLKVTWNNDTDNDYMFGEPFALEKQIGKAWVTIPMKNGYAFTMTGFGLPPHSKQDFTYDLGVFELPLTDGNYRFTSKYSDNITGSNKTYNASIEFTIK